MHNLSIEKKENMCFKKIFFLINSEKLSKFSPCLKNNFIYVIAIFKFKRQKYDTFRQKYDIISVLCVI